MGKGTRADIVKDSVTALGHPSISPDGKYLYFVSDAVGGYGGKDLFRARVAGSDFGPMENLGPDINTPGDEMFPYVRDSVTLYFASDGHPGMGGLDIFKATLDSTGKWNVENMKAPINSAGDDFGITFAGNKESGFLVPIAMMRVDMTICILSNCRLSLSLSKVSCRMWTRTR